MGIEFTEKVLRNTWMAAIHIFTSMSILQSIHTCTFLLLCTPGQSVAMQTQISFSPRTSTVYEAQRYILYMLGAICGSAISMDLLAQSMDPYSAQKSMDCTDICGSLRVVACAVRGKYSPARQRYYRTRVCCAISVVIFLDSLHYMFGQLFPTYQSGAKRKCIIIVILRAGTCLERLPWRRSDADGLWFCSVDCRGPLKCVKLFNFRLVEITNPSMYVCANNIVSYAKFMDRVAWSTDICAIHGFLRRVWIHRLRKQIHGYRRSTDCAQHIYHTRCKKLYLTSVSEKHEH